MPKAKVKTTRNNNAAMKAIDEMRSDIIKATHKKARKRMVKKAKREKELRELAEIEAKRLARVEMGLSPEEEVEEVVEEVEVEVEGVEVEDVEEE